LKVVELSASSSSWALLDWQAQALAKFGDKLSSALPTIKASREAELVDLMYKPLTFVNSTINFLVSETFLPYSPLMSSAISSPPPPSNLAIINATAFPPLDTVDCLPDPALVHLLNGSSSLHLDLSIDLSGEVQKSWGMTFSALLATAALIGAALIIHLGGWDTGGVTEKTHFQFHRFRFKFSTFDSN
jgi:hypothetical protein